ncbi:MAG: FlgD immunoglobulin-like domain containing protein, partial [Bacteroidota bacterium]
TDGKSTISLVRGINLIGVPLRDERLKHVSDLLSLEGIKENATAIIVFNPSDKVFRLVTRPGEDGDIPLIGGQSFVITARAAGVAEITGMAWDNVSGGPAAPSLMTGVGSGGAQLDVLQHETTPVLAIHGAVVNEITGGTVKDGFRVTVKNMSTGASLSTQSGGETSEGNYSMTFVDISSSRAAQVCDILEISVETPFSSVGIQPLRHVVSTDDVKAGQIRLPNLVAYEIPAKTELLPNYPNPFNQETWIPYQLAEDASVTLTIYDTIGRVVRTIPIGHKRAAVYTSKDKAIYWDGHNAYGERVASGIYFYTLTARRDAGSSPYTATRKMLVLK